MVPRQHFGPGNSIEIPMQKRRVRMSGTRKRWGVIPDSGFPRDGGMANEEERAKTTRARSKLGCISYNTHSYTGGRLVVIPLKRAFRGGSKSSREVDVLGTVVEVVVHVP